jgi:drug/metabolite transporter (DMT)-like permease
MIDNDIMSSHMTGLLIGGVLPAFLFGLTNVSAKMASNMGVGIGVYLLCVGIGVCLVGLGYLLVFPDFVLTAKTALISGFVGFSWGLGLSCVIIALTVYGSSISQLTPLFNMNTLITVFIGLVIFAEWKQVQIPTLILGSTLIVIGGIMVARS